MNGQYVCRMLPHRCRQINQCCSHCQQLNYGGKSYLYLIWAIYDGWMSLFPFLLLDRGFMPCTFIAVYFFLGVKVHPASGSHSRIDFWTQLLCYSTSSGVVIIFMWSYHYSRFFSRNDDAHHKSHAAHPSRSSLRYVHSCRFSKVSFWTYRPIRLCDTSDWTGYQQNFTVYIIPECPFEILPPQRRLWWYLLYLRIFPRMVATIWILYTLLASALYSWLRSQEVVKESLSRSHFGVHSFRAWTIYTFFKYSPSNF